MEKKYTITERELLNLMLDSMSKGMSLRQAQLMAGNSPLSGKELLTKWFETDVKNRLTPTT